MNHIIHNIYLGSLLDAQTVGSKMKRLYVHEYQPPDYQPTYHIPVLHGKALQDFEGGHVGSTDPYRKRKVNEVALEAAHIVLDDHASTYEPLLVHCIGGVERSPLLLATWLIKVGEHDDLDEAYRYLMSRRDVVQDRRHWL